MNPRQTWKGKMEDIETNIGVQYVKYGMQPKQF